MKEISKYVVRQDISILEALKALNELSNDVLTLFIIDDDNRMVGTLTDGDIRRKLIEGISLLKPVSDVMHRDFYYLYVGQDDFVEKIHLLRKKGITLLPILTFDFCIYKICNLKKIQSLLPVDAVLMAGGKGERLRPLTEKTPKPLLPVGDKAIIDYNIDRLLDFGIEHISVTVNYLKEQIEAHFDKPRGCVKINCVREPNYLGTMGSIQFIETFYHNTVLVMNSDLFTNIDYEDFYLHFKENQADMSVAAVPYSVHVPYGVFELDGRDVLGIKEKPTYNYYANAGIYLVKKKLLELIPDGEFFNATDFMEMLVSKGFHVVRFPLAGYWIDIGKHEDYRKAQDIARHLNR